MSPGWTFRGWLCVAIAQVRRRGLVTLPTSPTTEASEALGVLPSWPGTCEVHPTVSEQTAPIARAENLAVFMTRHQSGGYLHQRTVRERGRSGVWRAGPHHRRSACRRS